MTLQPAEVYLRLALTGLPVPENAAETAHLIDPIIARQRELNRRLADRLCPADARIQRFLDSYFEGIDERPQLPRRSLVLDCPGLARTLSLPANADAFTSPLLSSYRLANGVLHNPANDRRTTAGVFHISEGGSPIPDDKLAVPREVFARMLVRAFQPPESAMELPYTAGMAEPARCFVSLLLRPLVVPQVPGYSQAKTMETRFIVPGGLVANLDFVESVFGNAGDPYLPENDATLDQATFTGTTGCVILAPHLTRLTKKELGLPHIDQATERQRRDQMCWSDEDELYNNGQAFKCCARDERGVIVTVIADNYFGYCKKEVKTQLSYSANLIGGVEEEHSGGAVVFASYNNGQEFTEHTPDGYHLDDVVARDPERFACQPEGHALDLMQPRIVLVPANATFSLRTQTISWPAADGVATIQLRADRSYLSPVGFRTEMRQIAADGNQWSLISTQPMPTTCHKPATVSGGGKSEISKAISDAIIHGNAYTADYDADMEQVAAILDADLSGRFKDPDRRTDTRPILSDQRSVGSVIKLLTPSSVEYTDEYNDWLASIPQHIKELVFVIKRFYRPEWGADWRSHFTVGIMNGRKGNALRLDGERIQVNTLRVGLDEDGSWRIFGLRHDFNPAIKVQTEDDITASIVAPPGAARTWPTVSRKFVANCEQLLFQRPDDAIHRGYDTQAELDISQPGTFLSNFQPLDRDDAIAMRDDAIGYHAFTEPMRRLIGQVADGQVSETYFVSSANPRLVGGKPSKNPRYLQQRPDLSHPVSTEIADVAVHLLWRVPLSEQIALPVDLVAAGRRNNPAEPGVAPLCAYNPLHYMELPELFMEFISSMTGKSPSTTGAGSEGAMTKGPFNAMPTVYDLNAALLSYALTGYDGWLSAAGYVGPKVRVDHDVSLLVPEVFARMTAQERSAQALIENGCLERISDITYQGRLVRASRLGYRMTARFARWYFGRIFMHPHVVFTPEMLAPELQDLEAYCESVDTIVTTHERVAQAYLRDGSIEQACPPLRALLEIMAQGQSREGWDLTTADFRRLFERDTILASDWYAARLDSQQDADVRHIERGIATMEHFLQREGNEEAASRIGLEQRLARSRDELRWRRSAEYRAQLVGALGRQPLALPPAGF